MLKVLQAPAKYLNGIGLPVTLKKLGVTAEDENIHNMPFTVTVDTVYSAILAADRIGQD